MKSENCIFKKSVSVLSLTILVAFSLNACTKEEFSIGNIKLTTAASQVRLIIEKTQNSNNLIIDWGDGKKSNLNDATLDGISNWLYFSHEYSLNTTSRNIVITGDIKILICSNNQLTALDVSENSSLNYLNCSYNQLTKLDLSRNTMLNELNCNYNQIKSLELLKNSSLWAISCIGNQLTASALNDIFMSLPNYRGLQFNEIGTLYIAHRQPGPTDNPGVTNCDRSIAEKKGWVFRTE